MNEGGRREELLAATRRVVERSGFANATVGEITREAGASLGLLHYHFASKNQVVAEAFAQDRAGGPRAARGAVAAPRAGRPTAWRATSSCRNGRTTRAGGCGSTRGGRRSTRRRCERRWRSSRTGWRALLAAVLVDGVRERRLGVRRPRRISPRRSSAVIDGIGLHATLHPELVSPSRAQDWARRIVEAQLGVELSDPAPASTPRRSEHVATLTLRRSDLDAGPQTAVELCGEARDAWWGERMDGAGLEPQLIRLAIDLRRPLEPDDGPVTVRCALHRLGHSSIRTAESIVAADGSTVAVAEATLLLGRGLTDGEREALTGMSRSGLEPELLCGEGPDLRAGTVAGRPPGRRSATRRPKPSISASRGSVSWSGSTGWNSPLAIPKAIASANHSCRRP